MIWLRIYLLAGLVGHKVLWEVMKRGPVRPKPDPRILTRLVKLVKVGILLGILAQTLLPDVFPIAVEALPLRVTGVLLYTLGLALALGARLHLGDSWSDIEDSQPLVGRGVRSTGVYRFLRHPIYVGDLLLLAGLELALNSWLVVGVIGLTPVVLTQAIREERILLETLPGYSEYATRTKRFIPYIV